MITTHKSVNKKKIFQGRRRRRGLGFLGDERIFGI